MVYRLRCPHCGATQDHPFTRPGAVTVCGGCHTIWRIELVHVQRVPAERSAASPPAGPSPDPPPRRAAVSPGDSALHGSPDDTSIVGLSGLSEVMRGPGEPAAERDADAPLAAGSTADPPSPRQFRQQQSQALAQRRAAEAAAKRRSRTTLVLLATLTVMVGSLGVAVALIAANPRPASNATNTAPADSSGAQSPTGPPPQAEPDDTLRGVPRVIARPLSLRDPRLLAPARPGVRAAVVAFPQDEPQLEPNQIVLRLSATALADGAILGPNILLLTASRQGRLTAAWQLTNPRPLVPGRPHRLVANLDVVPEAADPDGWIVTALDPAAPASDPQQRERTDRP